jgi:hypothetical protein
MRKVFCLILACLAGYGCTRKANENSKPIAIPIKLITHKEAADSLRKDTTAPLKPLRIVDLSTDKTASFFFNHNLTALFFDSTLEGGYANRFDGFYGNDFYRIEFFFAGIAKDSLQPHVYHVKGKNRFKKTITPFEGTITFGKLATFTDPNLNEENYEHDDFELKEVYTAEADFELREEPTAKGSGIFSGKMRMDFFERKDGAVELWYFSPNAPAQAGGFKFDGTWTNYKKTLTKPVVWAKDLFMFANNILMDFSIGEREVEINKKYRHLGWDNYWENEEWWHDNSAVQ